MADPDHRLQARRALTGATVLGLLDAILLVPLVIAAILDERGVVSILGPLHGVGFVILVGVVAYGALRRFWGWWFPALVVVTLGPPGSIVGELRLRRRLPR
jgi:hypothetical protein